MSDASVTEDQQHVNPAVEAEPAAGGLTIAYLGVVGFVLVQYVRPNDWLPGYPTFPFAKIMAGIAIVGTLAALPRAVSTFGRLASAHRQLVFLMLLFGYFLLTMLTAEWKGGSFALITETLWKPLVITIIMAVTLSTVKRVIWLLYVPCTCMAVFAVIAIKTYSPNAEMRIEGPVGGILGNPNEFAINLMIMLPFCLAFMLASRNYAVKCFWAVGAIAMVGACLLTFSRGGFLMLGAVGLVALREFGFRGKRVSVIAFAMLVAVIAVVFIAPAGLSGRLSTILNPDTDVTNSAQTRRMLFYRSLEISAQHPIFGVGVGNFAQNAGNWQGTHNTYTQLSAEAGLPALLLFLFMVRRSFSDLRLLILKSQGQSRMLAQAAKASLAAFLVGAVFHHTAYQFYPYFLIAVIVGLSASAPRVAHAEPVREMPAELAMQY